MAASPRRPSINALVVVHLHINLSLSSFPLIYFLTFVACRSYDRDSGSHIEKGEREREIKEKRREKRHVNRERIYEEGREREREFYSFVKKKYWKLVFGGEKKTVAKCNYIKFSRFLFFSILIPRWR